MWPPIGIGTGFPSAIYVCDCKLNCLNWIYKSGHAGLNRLKSRQQSSVWITVPLNWLQQTSDFKVV